MKTNRPHYSWSQHYLWLKSKREFYKRYVLGEESKPNRYFGKGKELGRYLETGEILKGSNIENASYPVSICAERTLLSHAVSNYPNTKIDIITIYVDKDLETAVSPCGLCRQTLLEVESRQDQKIKIILISKSGNFIQFESCADLLPFNFNSDFL